MKFLITIIFSFFCFAPAYAVSEAAVLFLLIQPSPRAAAMGNASVASFDHSPMNVIFNPAHVGFAKAERKLGAEFYIRNLDLLPQFNLDDLYFSARSFTFGHSFDTKDGLGLNLGLSYSRVFANYGQQIITDETGPDPIGAFNSNESADILSMGLGVDWWLRAAIGVSYKFIDSNLGIVSAGAERGDGSAEVNSWDIGLYVELPILKSIEQLQEGMLAPYLNTSVGLVRANIGDKISYIDKSQSDPLPRVSRIGLGFQGGLRQSIGEREFDILSVEYLSEAQDLLVNRNSSGAVSFDTFSKINPFTHVILGNGDTEVITKRGLALGFAELFSLSIGHYEDNDGKVSYNTWGVSVKFQGLFNLRALLGHDEPVGSTIQFIRDNIDLEYYYSRYANTDNPALSDKAFHGLRIRLFK